MKDSYLPLASGLIFFIGFVHSYLGERYILIRLLRRDLPKIMGSDWFTKRTLRLAWHLTTVTWWGLAVLLLMLPAGPGEVSRQAALWVVVGIFGISGIVALAGSRGRHLSWIVFFAIALLAGLAANVEGRPHAEPRVLADVVSVNTSGAAGEFFEVGISSPDTGCQQYANWWEVVSREGELIYRRILTHSHITEQPFVRRGGPVQLSGDDVVWVRAYMHPTGYGGVAFRGSLRGGFAAAEPPDGFAHELAQLEPLPQGCAN